jgi:arsenite-transporting ATPase
MIPRTGSARPDLTPPFTFFGGKGGVGKTTCAAARAVAAASNGARVLVVSTDPAHSLGDALGVRLSSRVAPIRGVRRLMGVELDGPRAFARWLDAHRQALGDILEHGTWLDREDVDALLGLSIPGVDELIGMLEIVRLAGSPPAYDAVVVDTAPTGHMLRLLAAPATVATVAEVLDGLQAEHRFIREQIARVIRPEAADRLIAMLAAQAQETGALLRSPERASVHWVTLPEELSLAESEDALAALARSGIGVSTVIVNRVIPDGAPCPLCDRRRAAEHRTIARLGRRLGRGRAVWIVQADAREPRGVRALARIGRRLLGPPASRASLRSKPTPGRPAPESIGLDTAPASSALPLPPESIDAFRSARLIFFGGKGGVGKTTTAAAAAVRIARKWPERRVLLLSTDPAHSIGDVLQAAVGDRPAGVPKAPANLHAMELDAAAALATRRASLEDAFREISAAFGAGDSGLMATGVGVDRLMELAPPGIDELFGVLSVVELLSETGEAASRSSWPEINRPYDSIVVDTAPTGHALRLLEMPDAALGWVQVLMRVLLKYRSLARPGQLASELVDVSKSIRALQARLRDPRETSFVVVTRAAAMPRAETERLVKRLRALRLAIPAVVVNAMTFAPETKCSRCRSTAAAERAELTRLARLCRRRSAECVIIQTPMTAPPPRGVPALERWGRRWFPAG